VCMGFNGDGGAGGAVHVSVVASCFMVRWSSEIDVRALSSECESGQIARREHEAWVGMQVRGTSGERAVVRALSACVAVVRRTGLAGAGHESNFRDFFFMAFVLNLPGLTLPSATRSSS
jgi:hypothetical protein